MAHPKPETVTRLGICVPKDFDRESFSKLMVEAHAEESVDIVETVCFLEPHANGLKHHNCCGTLTPAQKHAAHDRAPAVVQMQTHARIHGMLINRMV